MRKRWLLFVVLAFAATPASAERLQFDHRLYPPLKNVLDSGDKDMVLFNNSNPARLVDLIATKGKSARKWTEALEIVASTPPREMATERGWMDVIRARSDKLCPNSVTIIAEDANSVTFERRSPACKAERAEVALYRLFAGKRSWFQLTVLSRTSLEDGARAQWLELLASAHLN